MKAKAIILFFGTLFLSFLIILQYGCKKEEEEFDQEKPTVSILYPAGSSQFSNDQVITIKGDANDNFGIKEVQFLIDGSIVSTVESEPYEYSWNIPEFTGNHTIKLKAYDDAGNIGESDVITVTIIDTDPNLIAYYPFTGNANDESGNSNDGTVTGASLTTDRFGNENYAYSFNGIDDYISTFDFNESVFSISYWVKTQSPKIQFFFSNITDAYDGIGMFSNSGDVYFSSGGGTSSVNSSTANVSLDDNQWHHIVGIYENTNNGIKIYIDNDLKIEETFLALNYSSTLVLGKRGSLTGDAAYHFDGSIDDIKIYKGILTQTEITDLYNEGGWTSK